MGKLKRFEDLEVWGASRELLKNVYAASGNAAFSKDYGLQSQIRRAAVSIVSNIAEGFESQTKNANFESLISNLESYFWLYKSIHGFLYGKTSDSTGPARLS